MSTRTTSAGVLRATRSVLSACVSLLLSLPLATATLHAAPATSASPPASTPSPSGGRDRDLQVLVVVGAEGEAAYGKRYIEEAKGWEDVCKKAGVPSKVIGTAPEVKDKPDVELLKAALQSHAEKPARPLWLILIGHGTFDGREAKFNLRGPDIRPEDLATSLKPLTGNVACIQTASASAPFVKALAGPNRVLISATKSADEVFYTRFGQFFIKAVSGAPEADLDRDNQVSLLEAFLWSSRQVDRFFETEQRLATEHAIIEDNGDGTGARAAEFAGVRLATPPTEGKTPEGQLARQWSLLLSDADAQLTEAQRQRRDALERDIESLKAKRKDLGEEEYYKKLEALLLDIAKLYADEKGT